MTSASELYHSRSSRLYSRYIDDMEFGFECPCERDPYFSHHRRRHSHSRHGHRHDSDFCDLCLRCPHLRHYRSSHYEHPSLSLDESNWQHAPSDSTTMERHRNIRRPGFSASERLPESVLLARERFLERHLERHRGLYLSGNRRSSREMSRMTLPEHMYDDHWRLADASDWETEVLTQSPSAGSHVNDSTLLSEQTTSTSMRKPPGLSQHALDQLHAEIFTYSEEGRECTMERILHGCSICLESFMKGDKLICLPCKHTFHSDCLDPWVRTCADCPYCRRVVTIPAE